MCRRENQKLFLRGDKCNSAKCPLIRRGFPPGIHGPDARTRRMTGYGIQLREKQKAKRIYGILERQFRNYFNKAVRKKGDTTQEIVRSLERRLDNVVFRLGFARSRKEARILVGHGHFNVNGQKVNIPSHSLKVGDLVEVAAKKQETAFFKDTIAPRLEKQQVPSWLSLDVKKWQGKVLRMPEGEDLKQGFDPKLIIEYYSR